jgi:hypothetical protein
MARLITVGDIITRARDRADMSNSGFITPASALAMFNESYTLLYDILVEAYSHYYATTDTLSLVSGTVAYDLPDDFYKLITADQVVSPGVFSTIFPYSELERNSTLTSDANSIPNVDVRLRYIPAPLYYTDLADTIDGVSGWEGLIVTDLAIMFLEKEETDTSALQARKVQQMSRIQSVSKNRDVTMPGTITDVTAYDFAVGAQLRYRFYGNQIEFANFTYSGI